MRQESAEQALERALSTMKTALERMQFGTLTLVFQDGRPIQLDKQEKIRLEQAATVTLKQTGQAWQSGVRQAAKGLAYGQIQLRIQNGRISQLERTDKQRFAEWEGVYGEGI
ncbi:YezD family protein [Azotosporobacter soli]|uniref:YezD family protein n=1 Tax=Azotosporobacter soli TaxID=3055040 RepID=UPI0031FF1E6F